MHVPVSSLYIIFMMFGLDARREVDPSVIIIINPKSLLDCMHE